MLSAETAIGKYPVLAVKEMSAIAVEIESNVKHNLDGFGTQLSVSEAISKSIFEITQVLPLKKIITLTRTGYTARIISRFRLPHSIIAVTPDQNVKKKLVMHYGVVPVEFSDFNSTNRIKSAAFFLFKKGMIKKEDLILFSAGIYHAGFTNLIEIHTISELLANRRRN
jgi:pyruvate kinase